MEGKLAQTQEFQSGSIFSHAPNFETFQERERCCSWKFEPLSPFNQKLHSMTTRVKPTSWQTANLEWDFTFRLNFTSRRGKCQFQSILICLVQHWSQVYDCFVNQNAPKISKLQFLLVIFWSQLSSNNICQKIYINRTQRLRSTWGKWGSVPDGPLWVTTQYALINPTPNLLPLVGSRGFSKEEKQLQQRKKSN